jgi:hypothetical protein
MNLESVEEWNLASNYHEHDITNAEFLRTYMSVDFPGGLLVKRLQAEIAGPATWERLKILPIQKKLVATMKFGYASLMIYMGFEASTRRCFS